MKKLILSFCLCCWFSSLASSDDLWASNGCHVAQMRCDNAQRNCYNAQSRAIGNRIDNFRNGPVEPYAQREALRSEEEARRICANANSICAEKERVCNAERAEQARARANRAL